MAMVEPVPLRLQEYQVVSGREGRSTHDLIRDLLAYCEGEPVPFDAICTVVEARLPQPLAAVRAVLIAYPYFVPMGDPSGEKTPWQFDARLHRRLLEVLLADPPVARPLWGPEPLPLADAGEPDPSHSAADSSESDADESAPSGPPSVPMLPEPGIPLRLRPVPFFVLLERLKAGEPLQPFDRAAAGLAGREWCDVQNEPIALHPRGAHLAAAAPMDRLAWAEVHLEDLSAWAPVRSRLLAAGSMDRAGAALALAEIGSALDPAWLLAWLGWTVSIRNEGSFVGEVITVRPGVASN